MSIQLLLAFFLTRHLRRSLKTFYPLSKWIEIFRIALYCIAGLFVLNFFIPEKILLWPGHLILLLIAYITFKKEEFSRTRSVILAVLPLMLLIFIGDIIKTASPRLHNTLETYLDVANIFAVIWMVAQLIISNKQNKALEKERRKTHEEEEQKKWMAARKAELESEVAERTAEITLQKEELQKALVDLKATQSQLVQQEKLASLGELTAGIAHEIQNPLNFVNNFSDVSTELVNELKTVLIEKLSDEEKKHTDEILFDLSQNLEKITHHGKRADSIVKSMMLHSRGGTGQKEPTDLNALADEYLRLAYHGLRAKDKSFNAQLVTDFDSELPKVKVVSQDIGRVLLNLYNNAFYSVIKKKMQLGEAYSPVVSLSIKHIGTLIEIRVRDNGTGIPQNVIDKIYQPFFTTKPTGEGIGLGLSMSYDIIKSHGGKMKVETQEGEYAEFIINLPLSQWHINKS